jgi:ribosomal subunit interface protein
MKTVYTARGLKIHSSLRDVVEPKIAKLEKVLPRSAKVGVVVRREKNEISVEVTVVARSHTWKATASGPDQRTAAQEVMDRIAAQAKKTKAIVKEEKKRSTTSVRQPEGWPEAAPPPRPPRSFRREAVTARAMFEEDALNAFGASARDVLVYRDLGAGEVLRVLYRRKDGTLALVTPD